MDCCLRTERFKTVSDILKNDFFDVSKDFKNLFVESAVHLENIEEE